MFLILIYIIGMNLVGYYLMFDDKQRAKQQKYRIQEKTLWNIAFLGGAIGMSIGMNRFRHKTKHLNFKIGFPFLAFLEVVIFIILLFYFS